jgi:putative Mg2+ transporter-C (MgtC) family protein
MVPIDVLLLRLLMVIIIGGLIGAERELKSKSAGFRTIMMICLGSFLFTTFSKYISPLTPDRIASNIVTGIGFLGAGVIFKNNNRVNGLTTAATIWISAALGMGVATGQYLFVCISAATVFVLLHFLQIRQDNTNKNLYYYNSRAGKHFKYLGSSI